MRHAMRKEEFLTIRDRQQESGLSIKDFCANESYPASSFYYWQSKFGLSRSYRTSPGPSNQFAPICFPAGKISSTSSVDSSSIVPGISIELPNGVKVHFTGSSALDTALGFITQLLGSHVLPE